MNINRLTFISALIITVAIAAIVIIYNAYKQYITPENIRAIFLVSLVVVFLLNYVVIQNLFLYYGRKEIRRMTTILPDEFIAENDNVGFKELGEKISGLTQMSSEIDMMKEMENYRKEYIGNVSHEMKTPLFSIQGYVETLMDGGIENLSIRDKYLDRINKSVERLLNIVTDLDMINKFESGEISLSNSKFDINALVKEVFDLLDLEAQKKGAKLMLQTTTGHLNVNADKQKISQVLINLVSNAINYSNREKAQITVITKAVNNKIRIDVQDNGMGIKPENLQRIFERFFRVESSRSRRDGGSGLGLAIVKHILEAHKEGISVESTYLEGTTFTFTLPAAS